MRTDGVCHNNRASRLVICNAKPVVSLTSSLGTAFSRWHNGLSVFSSEKQRQSVPKNCGAQPVACERPFWLEQRRRSEALGQWASGSQPAKYPKASEAGLGQIRRGSRCVQVEMGAAAADRRSVCRLRSFPLELVGSTPQWLVEPEKVVAW